MYSPKFDEKLISALYRLTKALNVPMTRLVKAIIARGIEQIERGEEVCKRHFKELLQE